MSDEILKRIEEKLDKVLAQRDVVWLANARAKGLCTRCGSRLMGGPTHICIDGGLEDYAPMGTDEANKQIIARRKAWDEL